MSFDGVVCGCIVNTRWPLGLYLNPARWNSSGRYAPDAAEGVFGANSYCGTSVCPGCDVVRTGFGVNGFGTLPVFPLERTVRGPLSVVIDSSTMSGWPKFVFTWLGGRENCLFGDCVNASPGLRTPRNLRSAEIAPDAVMSVCLAATAVPAPVRLSCAFVTCAPVSVCRTLRYLPGKRS